jgi:hypothetical protein
MFSSPIRYSGANWSKLRTTFGFSRTYNYNKIYTVCYQEGICLFRIRSRSSKHPATATQKDGQRRDKEITCKIQRFLTQMKFRIDHIHAFFSMPFPTILGRRPCSPTFSTWFSLVRQDVKDSICMIVTFADMARRIRAESPRVNELGLINKNEILRFQF